MEFLALGIIPLLFLCSSDWQRGLLITVAVGLLQDVIRKLLPGEPVYLVLLFVPFLLTSVAAAMRSDISLRPVEVFRRLDLRVAIYIYCVVVSIQILVSYLMTGSLKVSLLGVIAYLFPIAGILFATAYARFQPHFVTLFHVYIVISFFMSLGVFMRTYGIDWPIVDSVGDGIFIYPPSGGRVELPAGFFRSPEVAAWHCTTASLLTLVLMVSRLWRGRLIVGLLMAIVMLAAMLMTGRRKMLVEIVIFGIVFGGLMLMQGRSTAKLLIIVLLSVGLVLTIDSLMWTGFKDQMFVPYVERTLLLHEEIFNRAQIMLIDSFQWAYARAGWFGLGAGTASQGAQHLSTGPSLAGGAGEGGLAKIFVELGIQGVAAVILFMFAFARSILVQLKFAGSERCQGPFAIFHAGMVAVVISNFAAYTVASQIYGDPFVLFLLGMFTGITMAATSYPSQQGLAMQQRANPKLSGSKALA